jgi:NTE family protein
MKEKETTLESLECSESFKNLEKLQSLYTTLVLSGGGMKGIAMLGALQHLQDSSKLYHVDRIIGTSIGAIIGYLWCIGYTPIELMVFLCQKQHQEFLHLLTLTQWDVMNCMQGHRGAIPYMVIQELLEKLSMDKMSTLLTLKQLKEKSGKTLVCCTYNRTHHKTEFLSAETYPDLPCLMALRMSSAIPFVFDACFFQNNLYADGGLVENIPLSPVKADEKAIVLYFYDGKKFSSTSSTDDVAFMDNMMDLFVTVIHRFEDLLLENFKRKQEYGTDGKIQSLYIRIPVSFKTTLQFDLPKVDLFDMFSVGYQASRENLL